MNESSSRLARTAWILGGFALLLIFAFDLGPALAFNDDWGMAWQARHFDLLHLRFYPSESALALVQVAFAKMISLGHNDQRLFRLSEIAFIVLTMYSMHGIARRLGADPVWSAVAAVTPLAFPVFTADATTFMTDVPYVGLLSAAALGAVRWRDGGRWAAVCVVFAALATLQRQVGIAIPPAVTLALLLLSRRSLTRRDWTWLALLLLACLLAFALPIATGITPPTQGNRLAAAAAPVPVIAVTALMFLPGLVGLGLLAFLPGLALSGQLLAGRDRTRQIVFAIVIFEVLVLVINGSDIFPGNVFQPGGFNITTLNPSRKPQLFPTPVFLVMEAASVVTAAYLVRRWKLLATTDVRESAVLLVLIAAFQFLPLTLLHYIPYDRYYLPVVAMLTPLAARAASHTRMELAAGRFSLGLIAAMIVVYVVGEQDFLAWQYARDEAARVAYSQFSPYEVNAGYEANAVYGEVPWYDQTGQVLGNLGVPGAYDFSLDGPRDPRAVLEYANPDDQSPGFSWTSLAPGRIVIVTIVAPAR